MEERPVTLWTPERWARFERARTTRRSALRWRWAMVGIGALLAVALLVRGNVVIGGLLAILLGARVVLLSRLTRLSRLRGARPAGDVIPTRDPDA